MAKRRTWFLTNITQPANNSPMKNTVPLIVIIIVLIIGGFFLFNRSNSSTTDTNTTLTPTASPTAQVTAVPEGAENITNVEIKDLAFNPSTITIKKGDTVAWTNKDSMPHTVTSDYEDGKGPDSTLFGTDEVYGFTFLTAGTFEYYCQLHATTMKGTVIVTE